MKTYFLCCKDCEERTVEPNCHTTCGLYLEAVEKRQAVTRAATVEKVIYDYVRENKAKRR